MRLQPHEFDAVAMKNRGAVSGGFCRRKDYTDGAARRVLLSHWNFLVKGMEELGIPPSDKLREEFSSAFWEAFRPNGPAVRRLATSRFEPKRTTLALRQNDEI